MSQIDPYIISLVYSDRAEFGLGSDFRRAEEIIPLIRKIVREVVVHYGAPESITDIQSVAEKIFNQLISVDAFQSERHDFAGVYYRFIQNRYNAFRVEHAQKDKIFLASQRIGSRYFRDVFAGFLGQQKAEDVEAAIRSSVVVPASDRIILSTDNMPSIIDELEILKNAIDGDNDELGKLTGRRERLVSEITAG